MTEYIDKNTAITAVGEAIADGASWFDALERIQPADVRPVVLCKDCDLWNEWDSSGRESLGTYRCSCAEWTTEITTYYTGPDEFCSRGVRRDMEKNKRKDVVLKGATRHRS